MKDHLKSKELLEIAIQKAKQQLEKDPWRREDEKTVIAKYGPMFSPQNLQNLTADDFISFLLFKNNKHWSGLQRLGSIPSSLCFLIVNFGKKILPHIKIESFCSKICRYFN